jgi:hypothetical protein
MSHRGKREPSNRADERTMRLALDPLEQDAVVALMDPNDVDRLVKWDTKVLADVQTNRMTQADRVESAARFFKRVLLFACTTEAVNRAGCKTIADIRGVDAQALIHAIERSMGLPWAPTLHAVLGEGHRQLDPQQPIPRIEEARQLVGSVCASTDSRSLLASAKDAGIEGDISFALQKLNEFLRRTDPFLKSRLEAVASQYSGGTLSLGQLANVLGVDEVDALFLLDELGIGRPASAMRLTDSARKDRLATIERDRARREGKPRGDAEQATAAAISNARLEGVDARGCLTNR